ncbi:MAG: polysaccharide lyase 6 family protein [Acidobacteriota bacterium]|nr:polysaccharide lyase 6 family protein [Acidobacteriota bacterium]
MRLCRFTFPAALVAMLLTILMTSASALSWSSVADLAGVQNPSANNTGNPLIKFEVTPADHRHTNISHVVGALARTPTPSLGDDDIPTAKRTLKVSTLADLETKIQSAEPGDHLVVANGVYTTSDWITVQKNGTQDAPVVITAANVGGAEIKGAAGFKILDSSFIVIRGFKFTHGIRTGKGGAGMLLNGSHQIRVSRNHFRLDDTTGNSHWLMVTGNGSGHNRIDHNKFENKPSANNFLAIYGPHKTGMSQYDRVDHNYFLKQTYTEEGGEAVRVGVSTRALSSGFTLFEDNLFEECNGDPEVISNKSCDNTFRYNTFRNNAGSLVLRHGNRSEVYGNFFINNAGGIRFYGDFHKIYNNYLQGGTGTGAQSTIFVTSGCTEDDKGQGSDCNRPDGVIVAFNTLINNSTNVVIGLAKRPLPPKDCIIANNLIQTNSGKVVEFNVTPLNFTWQGNIVSGNADNGDMPSSGFIRLNPRLSSKTNGMFRLLRSSPAINKSANSSSYSYVTRDMDGQPRTGLKDVGADEFSNGRVTRRPLNSDDVGPTAP